MAVVRIYSSPFTASPFIASPFTASSFTGRAHGSKFSFSGFLLYIVDSFSEAREIIFFKASNYFPVLRLPFAENAGGTL